MRLPGVWVTIRRLIVAFVLLVLSFMMFMLYSQQQHLEWYRRVEDCIIRLADKRPDAVSPNRWAFCVSWTWQLHGNYGGYYYFDHGARAEFLAEFDRRLTGTVDLGTIDWIWDEYIKHSTGGRHYSQGYRPTDPDHVRQFFEGYEASY